MDPVTGRVGTRAQVCRLQSSCGTSLPAGCVRQGDLKKSHPHPFKFCDNEAHCRKHYTLLKVLLTLSEHMKMVKVKQTFVDIGFF